MQYVKAETSTFVHNMKALPRSSFAVFAKSLRILQLCLSTTYDNYDLHKHNISSLQKIQIVIFYIPYNPLTHLKKILPFCIAVWHYHSPYTTTVPTCTINDDSADYDDGINLLTPVGLHSSQNVTETQQSNTETPWLGLRHTWYVSIVNSKNRPTASNRILSSNLWNNQFLHTDFAVGACTLATFVDLVGFLLYALRFSWCSSSMELTSGLSWCLDPIWCFMLSTWLLLPLSSPLACLFEATLSLSPFPILRSFYRSALFSPCDGV